MLLDLSTALPEAPEFRPTLLWQYVPWPHIRGAVKRELGVWDPYDMATVDLVEEDLDNRLVKIMKKYVKQSKPKKHPPVYW